VPAGLTVFVDANVMLGEVPAAGSPEIQLPFLENQILLSLIATPTTSFAELHDVSPVVVVP
jgi:hypothetical protein